MSVTITERHVGAAPAAPDVALPPLPSHWTSLPRAFLHTARANWSKDAMADSTKASLTYGSALTRALALGRALGRELGPEPYVGVMVPPSVAGAVVNIGLMLIGKIPINLNYSGSQAVIDAAVDRCQIRQVITARKVVEKLKLIPKGTLVHLEDMPAKVGAVDKAWAVLMARVVPVAALGSFLPGLRGDRPEATASVMFTSGSTGDPKGVVLTHGNVLSNVHQIRHHLRLDPLDVVSLGVLPFFHSFGYTVGIWTILLLGKKVVYHSNPLDAKIVGNLCEEHKITLLPASPTFAGLYIKRKPEQFRHIVHLLLGSEKLQPETLDEIVRTIGVDPLEGYGTTEMSPVAAVNVPFEVTLPDGRVVAGNRHGTVGRPLPGTTVKTIGLEPPHADLPRGAEGEILVKGPQIMAGYMDNPEATAKVLREGFYATGDIGHLDPDGFLVITGRITRFAKIGGEMVGLDGVERALKLAGGLEPTALAAVAVKDLKRGERVVVIHAPMEASPAEICRKALASGGLSRLALPAAEDFIAVDAIPLLGTGKVDYQSLKKIAAEAQANPPSNRRDAPGKAEGEAEAG